MGNTMINKNILIISATSDIGFDICKRWKKQGHNVIGSYRTKNSNYEKLSAMGIDLIHLDLSQKETIRSFLKSLSTHSNAWDILILCPANMEPIGNFTEVDIDKWEETVNTNFTKQMGLLHKILPYKNKKETSSVILFSGSGTNNAPAYYSAYTISKIASIKMMELLDAEIEDTKFMIYGPGWVKTKIHQQTLDAKESVGEHYQTTLDKLDSNECTNIDTVIDAIEWGISMNKEVIGGRNISVVFDKWGSNELELELKENKDMYKLRRYKNDWE